MDTHVTICARIFGPRQFLGLLALLTAVVANPARAEQTPDRTIQLVLRHALFVGQAQDADSASLLVDARQQDGQWATVLGRGDSFNKAIHVGRVVSADIGAERMKIDLSVKVRPDAWVDGGWLVVSASLDRGKDGQWVGTYEGTFRHQPIRGRALAEVQSLPAPAKGRSAVAPGEHPRLLFRKADLPALHKKMDTPLGKAALARMTDAMGEGVKYQLTDDPAHARKARTLVENLMADTGAGDKMVRARIWGWRLEQVAMAYDLCYDAWDADFREKVRDYMVRYGNRVFYGKNLFHKEINWHITGTYPGTIYYGAALAGIAAWGAQGPAPEPPAKPFAVREENTTIPPAKGYTPGKGVPVEGFPDGQVPSQWIFVGGYKPDRGDDPLEELGGVAAARPQVGDKVTYKDRSEAFAPVPAKGYFKHPKYTGGRKLIDITNAIGRVYYSTSFFYTVIRNDKARWVRLETGHGAADVYLNGQRLVDGDYLRIQPGLYPMMVSVAIGETPPWGKVFMGPTLREVPEKQARQGIANVRDEYQQEHGLWKTRLQRWQASGKLDPEITRFYEIGRFQMASYYREALGTGGFQAGTHYSMDGPPKYAAAHRTAFAQPVTPQKDIEAYLPGRMFLHQFSPDGKLVAQEVGGTGKPGFIRSTYIEPDQNVANEYIAPLLPVTPQEYQPAVLWMWHALAGVDGPDQTPKLLETARKPYVGPYQSHASWTFVNYPLDATPQPPAKVLPLTWQAPDAGVYGFRSGWEGLSNVLLSVYAHRVRGGTAGSFRLVGFGTPWTHGQRVPPNDRFAENVVLLPEDAINERASGKVTYLKTAKDGSGVVTIDLADVYASAETNAKGEPAELYERMLDLRQDANFADSDIEGLRSIGMDYSGASGAEALLVIVDKITGGKNRTWMWQLDASREKAGQGSWADQDKGIMQWQGRKMPYRVGATIKVETEKIADGPLVKMVQVTGDGFRMSQNGATLAATFVTPGKPAVELAEKRHYRIGYKRTISMNRSRAISVDGKNHFFCVITLGPGESPKVKVDGQGLDAVVTVGEQTVRFDGEKIVFGK